MTKIVTLDFELAGVLDLADVGVDAWTKHPDTVPILTGFAIDHDEPRTIEFAATTPGAGDAKEFELLNAVASGAEIHAWNANFEWSVWNNICVPRFDWPALLIERFHCSMATAACAGLPMSLEDAAIAIGSTAVKDKAGRALMLRMARPRSIDPNNGFIHWWHREDAAKVKQLIAYNIADVEAERELHYRMPRMSRREREIWLVDQHMNARGLPVDGALLDKLSELTLVEWLRLDREIAALTKGAVTGSTQNLKLLEWVQARGYPHDTLEKDTLTQFIASPEFSMLDPDVQGVLLARAERSKTSTAKLKAISGYAQTDGVARNLVQYGGAVRTLRWAGRGPQIQNFPRPAIKHVDEAIDEILGGMNADGLRHLFGRPLDVVSSCLRGVFKAPKDERFVVADFHAIEAIVLAWLAESEDLLDVFRRHEDVYVYTANTIGSNNRLLGKIMRLALGYGMGHVKFQATAASYGVDVALSMANNLVNAFRLANKPIVELWHACERQAMKAILHPTMLFQFKKLKFYMADPDRRLAGALLMELPSGRKLVYRNARIDNGRIAFWGVNQYTRNWEELNTYGGKLVENATQAVARDLLAEAIVEVDREFPGALRTTVHDEIVAIAGAGEASRLLERMKEIMSDIPAWGNGLPLSAAGAVAQRYGKL